MKSGDCITFSQGHGMEPGDVIYITRAGSRLAKLLYMLAKPRVTEVVAVTESSVEFRERRMTWAEWRRGIWRTITWKYP